MRRHSSPLHRTLASALLGLCLALSASAVAQGDEDALTAQRRIEAAYLYKFGAYITWPEDMFAAPDSAFVIGVAGDDQMADELTALVAGRSIGGRSVTVRKIRVGQATTGIPLLFVAGGTPQGDSLLGAARDKPTVTVTEGTDGLDRGADMTFVLVNDRVRFDIALDAAQRDGVKVSSQLLSVADKVTGAKP
jgi:hypothetical protein